MQALRTHVLLVAAIGMTPPLLGQSPRDRDWSLETARPVADWVRDAVVYEVFPRAFSPEGNLAGVTARLDHLRDLGIDVVWLMPIHPIGVEKRKGTLGSPYSVRDFRAVNPDYGTVDDLKHLVREAHARGLKVILDVVANHTAWDSVMMARPELYVRDPSGRVLPPNPDWSDVAELDYSNPTLRAEMIDVMVFWVRELDVDGFRCDMAGLVPTDFWEEAREALEAVRPGLLLLAEWSAPELMARAFDVDYAWPFHAALNRVLLLGEPASLLRAAWEEERRSFPRGSLHLRFSDNHDERRAVARFGEPAALAAAALVLTLDGVPLVYNGMEVGDTTESGGPALFERLPIFWAGAERRPAFLKAFRDLIALRRAHAALRRGETVWTASSSPERIVSFLRRGPAEDVLVALNLSSQPWAGTLELPRGGPFREITPDIPLPRQPGGGTPEKRPRAVDLPALGLDAWGFRLFSRSR